MIITGTAGTGKSFTIDGMITELLTRLDERGTVGKEVLVLAPTGRAAMQAKGFTLHCAEGLSIPILLGKHLIELKLSIVNRHVTGDYFCLVNHDKVMEMESRHWWVTSFSNCKKDVRILLLLL